MGVVYAAYELELDRRLALKLLHRPWVEVGERDDNRRLLREAQALVRLVSSSRRPTSPPSFASPTPICG